MEIRRLEIPDVFLIKPVRRGDDRGWFAETYKASVLAEAGVTHPFVQDNMSLSRHEGFGIAAIEAMSAGLVPVLARIPPYARLVGEAGLGVLVDAHAPQAAADAVASLADLPAAAFQARRRAAMAHAGRYDWNAVVRRYRDEYHQIQPRATQTAGSVR